MDDLTNDSVLGRLLEEISWERAVRYRQGGRGMENVLTAEVFMPLDYLPRTEFLGEVFRRGHGADGARVAVVAEIEQARFTLLPDEVLIGPNAVKVQPDGFLESSSALVLLEAKRIRSSSFQAKQLAREVLALLQQSQGRIPLLFLVLGAPPPVRVDTLGRVQPAEAISRTIAEVAAETGADEVVTAELLEGVPEMIAWITWSEVGALVADQAALFADLPSGLGGTVRRLASAVTAAVAWHT
jgi:hypothetical protein